MKVVGLDHIALNVADPRRALEFYAGELGLEPVRVEEWERGEVLFPSVRVDESTVIDLLKVERSGENVNHLCLVLEAGTDLDALAASGRFEVVDGPDDRWGARGVARALLYVRDPDGNVVELRSY
ncbi:VOC family protein [Rhabdothermincola sediminis]|uniref:VOC family protein n=1 Tax=Rhabdothermincola sediminis TaxID=2751370 RepID=UPI001AA09893|nr:VOC family protein [Rhabdothermincola sediminis]